MSTALSMIGVRGFLIDAPEYGRLRSSPDGARVIMGKMMMDLGSYGKLEPTQIVSVSLQESERLCKTWHGGAGGLLEYAVSPRFAIACSEEMMRAAAALAAKHGAYIQTHLAEN